VKEPIAAFAQSKVLAVAVVKSSFPLLREVRDKVLGSETCVKLSVGLLGFIRAAGDKVNDVVVLTSLVVDVFAANANEPLENVGSAEAGTVPSTTSTRATPAAVKKRHFLIPIPSFHFWTLTGAIHR
jgi:hypothetical protein